MKSHTLDETLIQSIENFASQESNATQIKSAKDFRLMIGAEEPNDVESKIGDEMVALIIKAYCWNVDLEDALRSSSKEIKDFLAVRQPTPKRCRSDNILGRFV